MRLGMGISNGSCHFFNLKSGITAKINAICQQNELSITGKLSEA